MKESISAAADGKPGLGRASGNIKLDFLLKNNKTIFANIKNDSFKVHYDNGIVEAKKFDYNFYVSFQGTKALKNPTLKIGTTEFWKNGLEVDTRVKIFENNYYLGNRVKFEKNNFLYQAYSVSNPQANIFHKFGLLLGYAKNKDIVNLRAESNGWFNKSFKNTSAKDMFNNISLDYTRKSNENY